MAFYKITYNEQYRFATVHNYGCTFHCSTCSYKLRSGSSGKPGLAFPAPKQYLETAEIKEALRQLPIKNLYFMGGEPTVAKDLPEILRFAKEELNVGTRLGHTNGSKIPLPYLDGANVGLKACDEDLHRTITGQERNRIFANVAAAHLSISIKWKASPLGWPPWIKTSPFTSWDIFPFPVSPIHSPRLNR